MLDVVNDKARFVLVAFRMAPAIKTEGDVLAPKQRVDVDDFNIIILISSR